MEIERILAEADEFLQKAEDMAEEGKDGGNGFQANTLLYIKALYYVQRAIYAQNRIIIGDLREYPGAPLKYFSKCAKKSSKRISAL